MCEVRIWKPSSGKLFIMLVVVPEMPGALLFFIFLTAALISSIKGAVSRDVNAGLWVSSTSMEGSIVAFLLKTSWKKDFRIIALSLSFDDVFRCCLRSFLVCNFCDVH